MPIRKEPVCGLGYNRGSFRTHLPGIWRGHDVRARSEALPGWQREPSVPPARCVRKGALLQPKPQTGSFRIGIKTSSFRKEN